MQEGELMRIDSPDITPDDTVNSEIILKNNKNTCIPFSVLGALTKQLSLSRDNLVLQNLATSFAPEGI